MHSFPMFLAHKPVVQFTLATSHLKPQPRKFSITFAQDQLKVSAFSPRRIVRLFHFWMFPLHKFSIQTRRCENSQSAVKKSKSDGESLLPSQLPSCWQSNKTVLLEMCF